MSLPFWSREDFIQIYKRSVIRFYQEQDCKFMINELNNELAHSYLHINGINIILKNRRIS